MKPRQIILFATVLTACSHASSSSAPAAVASLRDAAGRDVGSVSVSAAPTGVRFQIRVNGLPPGAHGIHVHAVGTCDGSTTPAFSSAGGHYNPTSKQHGRLNPNGWHLGDLPNITVDAKGAGSLDVVVESLTLDTGTSALLDADGSAVVIHANQDDERTDTGPSGPGNSGARIACGVVRRA